MCRASSSRFSGDAAPSCPASSTSWSKCSSCLSTPEPRCGPTSSPILAGRASAHAAATRGWWVEGPRLRAGGGPPPPEFEEEMGAGARQCDLGQLRMKEDPTDVQAGGGRQFHLREPEDARLEVRTGQWAEL